MGRSPRITVGGIAYHVLNRGNGRMKLFERTTDYEAFEELLVAAIARLDIRLCAYCLMPNHWHMIVWPRANGDLSCFFQWLTLTHTQRWHAHRGTAGFGHLYQSRFKSFPVETDEHFLTVCRYGEANARRAGMVNRAEEWRWSSLWRRCHADVAPPLALSRWPIDVPKHWLRLANEPLPKRDLEALRTSVARGRPFGSQTWQARTAMSLGLESTLRARGRPRKGV